MLPAAEPQQRQPAHGGQGQRGRFGRGCRRGVAQLEGIQHRVVRARGDAVKINFLRGRVRRERADGELSQSASVAAVVAIQTDRVARRARRVEIIVFIERFAET